MATYKVINWNTASRHAPETLVVCSSITKCEEYMKAYGIPEGQGQEIVKVDKWGINTPIRRLAKVN